MVKKVDLKTDKFHKILQTFKIDFKINIKTKSTSCTRIIKEQTKFLISYNKRFKFYDYSDKLELLNKLSYFNLL